MFEVEEFYWNGAERDTNAFLNLMAAASAEGSEVTIVQRGDSIQLGDFEIDVLHPFGLTGDSNGDSVVLQFGCGVFEVLLMADATAESEAAMMDADVLSEVSVLRIGSHGSPFSSSAAFLDRVNPRHVVISAGMDASFTRPHRQVLQRLVDHRVWSIHTDETEQDDTANPRVDCAPIVRWSSDVLRRGSYTPIYAN